SVGDTEDGGRVEHDVLVSLRQLLDELRSTIAGNQFAGIGGDRTRSENGKVISNAALNEAHQVLIPCEKVRYSCLIRNLKSIPNRWIPQVEIDKQSVAPASRQAIGQRKRRAGFAFTWRRTCEHCNVRKAVH